MPDPPGPTGRHGQIPYPAPVNAENGSRLSFTNFPKESVEIKMEKSRCGDDANENMFDGLNGDTGRRQGDRAVGQNQADIDTDERAATPENETHEPADALIAFHPGAIVDPDNREILHVVENFKERNPDEDVLHAVIAVPPKSDTADQQRDFDGADNAPLGPISPLSPSEHRRYHPQRQNHNIPPARHHSGRDYSSAAFIIKLEARSETHR